MQSTAADERRHQQQQQARTDVWRAVPGMRRIMAYLPGRQWASLLDADAGSRTQAGEWVWLELQRVVRHLRGAGARLVWRRHRGRGSRRR